MQTSSNSTIQRGDIFYIIDDPDQPPVGSEEWGNRAGIVISNQGLCNTSPVLTVVWLSTSENKIPSPTHIPVTSGKKTAIALCEHPDSADISRFRQKFGHVPEEEMAQVDAGVMFGLQLNTGVNPQGIFKKWEHYIKKYQLRTDAILPNTKKLNKLKRTS